MDYLIHIDTISMDLSILCFKGFLNFNIFRALKIVFILANSVDPDKILHYAAYHLGFHCLPKYPGDKNISILHLSCRMSDLQFSLVLQTDALVL